jgi:hypothetical protein
MRTLANGKEVIEIEFVGGEMDGERRVIPNRRAVYRFAKMEPIDYFASYNPYAYSEPKIRNIDYVPYGTGKSGRELYILDSMRGKL